MNIKDQVIQAKRDGMSYSEIKSQFGIAKSTAFDWVKAQNNLDKFDIADEGLILPRGFINEHRKKEKDKKAEKSAEHLFEFLEELPPIVVKPRNKSVVSKSTTDYAVVIGDMHFPMHCNKTLDIFFETIRELNPSTIVLNGDTVDMLATSKFPKDIRHTFSLSDERKAYHEFLDTLLSVSGDAKIYEIDANHSGNGSEGRWWRYLSDRLKELADLPDVIEALSYGNVFLGAYQDNVELVDYLNLTDDFIILHGDVVRKNGGYSARGMLDKLQVSLMHNHTHRFGFTAQRVPAIGNRKDQQLYAWENGCACDLNPIYASSPNWQNGFSIVGLGKSNEFSVEQVMVNDGVAHIATLGKSIKAT